MHKRKKGRKFSRERGLRQAFLQSLAAALVRHGRIKTTEARAKEIRGLAERIVTYEKKGGVANRRRVAALIGKNLEKDAAKEHATRHKGHAGGYTRIRKLGPRKSDGARMAIIEFVK